MTAPDRDERGDTSGGRRSPLRLWLGLGALAVAALIVAALLTRPAGRTVPAASLAANPVLDPGTPLSGPAPDFTLTDQFGRPMSLHEYRGKVVILAFNDSQCTTICPLTTTAMVEAQGLLGPAGREVALLGIDANPQATSVSDVRAYSQAHAMLHQWRFGTAPLHRLEQVWQAYHVDSAIENGQVDHTPALFIIDRQGRLNRLYLTQQSYAAVPQLGQLLAQQAALLLPGHPKLRSLRSYAQIPAVAPTSPVTLPRAGGGTIRLGPGAPRLLFFFATWTQETLDLRGQLATIQRYRSAAPAAGLPQVVAVDEASVEPSSGALPAFLRSLRHPLSVPVAIDRTGQVADGYEVEDQPWLALVSATGRFLWYYDVSTAGVITLRELEHEVRAALARAPETAAPTGAQADAALAGSPPPLAALHAQAGRLLGSVHDLQARLRALRGYPVILNAWGSWCTPCQKEFPLFAQAAVSYGKRVAFIGVDTRDFPDQAQAFLAGHPVSYPSYQAPQSFDLDPIVPAGISLLPSTIFIDRAGHVVHLHIGQYEALGTLDSEIAQYLLGH